MPWIRLIPAMFAVLVATSAAAAERVGVRVGEHPAFSRLVFDWTRPVGARLERREGAVILHFDRAAELDLARFRADPPPHVLGLDVAPEGGGLAVTVTTTPGAAARMFESEGKTVLDVHKPDDPPKVPEPPQKEKADAEPPKATAAEAITAPPVVNEPSVQAPMSLLPPALDRPPPEATELKPSPAPVAPGSEPDRASDATAVIPKPKPKSKPATAGTDTQTVETGGPRDARAAPPQGADQTAPRPVKPNADPKPALVDVVAAPLVVDPSPRPGRTLMRSSPRSVRFDWPDGTGAAAFRRGDKLWLVFDRPPAGNLAALVGEAVPELKPVEQLESPSATVLRFAATPNLVPQLRRDGAAWIVEFGDGASNGGVSLEPLVVDQGTQALIRYPVSNPGRIVDVVDPDLGDRLMVVPVANEGPASPIFREFPQFRVLASQLGLVIQPLSEGLRVSATPDAVEIGDATGLIVSHGASLARLKFNVASPRRGKRLFDLEAWRHGDADDFRANKHILQMALALAGAQDVEAARLELGRFYFAHGLAIEALGVLRLSESKAPRASSDPRVRLMLAASAFLIGDLEAAAETLSDPALTGEWEASLWRAAVAAKNQEWAVAARQFAGTEALLADYPRPVRVRLRLLAAEAALMTGEMEVLERHLQALRQDDLTGAEEVQTAVLFGHQLHLGGYTHAAVVLWQRVAASQHPPSQIRARLALLDLGLADGSISAEDAIEELERLRFAWRGDTFEIALLERLGDLYLQRRDYRTGLRLLRRAATQAANAQASEAIVGRMRDIFVGLFMTASGDALSPLQALALFGEFKELTPAGPEGDALVIALADRLVTVDLLDRAAAELERQVEFRLEGAAKARVAARLAEIRLLDKEPTKALAALDGTEMPGLPEEITAARRVLRARALMELNQPDEALAALGADDGQAALRLRVQILRRQQNWPATVLALERLVPAAPPAKRSLTEDESRDVVDLAVALIIAGDRKKMLALGQTYGTAMSRGPHRDTFDLLVGDLDAGRAKTVAEELAQVDTAEAFLASYRKQSVTRPGEAQ